MRLDFFRIESKKIPFVKNLLFYGTLSIVILGSIGCLHYPIFVEFYEDVSFYLDSSAARAFEYGQRHLSSQNGRLYNINRAGFFLTLAEKIDTTLPYVHHELARIAFLSGDFDTAMKEINVQITQHGTSTPNSFYVRGLIEGYMGNYTDAARDYEIFFEYNPHNWATINDYAWVLLKAGRSQDAAKLTTIGLEMFPDNAWLLNSNAIALYEIGNVTQSRTQAEKAKSAVALLTERDWILSYPGNDPGIALQGLATFKSATINNLAKILNNATSSTVQ